MVTAAGTDRCGALGDVPAAEWERVVAVNLFGTAAVVRAALPALKESRGKDRHGRLDAGPAALPDATAYCASKFGVVGMTRALATELAGQVGVTLLVPGGMDTAFFDGRPDQYKPGPDAQLNDPARRRGGRRVRADPGERLRAAGDGGLPVHRAVVALSGQRG